MRNLSLVKDLLKKVTVTMTAFALTGALLTGCGNSANAGSNGKAESESSSSESKDEESKKIRIGCVGQGNVLGAAVGVADELGYMKEELEKVGYDYEIIGFAQAGPAVNEAFAAGEIDLAFYGDLPGTVCKANGTDTTIFATYDSKMQMGIFVRDGVDDIKSAADLPGHKTIVARGTIFHQYFNSIIKDAGVEEDDIEQINTFSDANSLISSGDADVLITSTSIAYYLESLGLGKLVADSTGEDRLSSQFFGIGKTDFLKANKEAVKAIIKAMLRGKEEVIANPDEAYKIWADRQDGYTPEIFEKEHAYDSTFDSFSPGFTDQTYEKLDALNSFLVEEGLIGEAPDPHEFIDETYYNEAIEEYEAENK
ncbi:MAG: ABC transporter substrate-binding protein [Lachnospiraceae bacterium]|nr:ABC transporter substrate-binding protein [Lachnospiraceae bacterium]